MINKKISNRKRNNKRLSKKNIRKSKKANLIGGLNCGAVLDEETCRARAPECQWEQPANRCIENPVRAAAAAARARVAAARAAPPVVAVRAAPPVVAVRAAPPVVAVRAVPPVAVRAAPPVVAVRAAPPVVVRAAPQVAVRAAPPVVAANPLVAADRVPVAAVPGSIVYQIIEIPDVIDYFNLQDRIIARATEDYNAAMIEYNRVGSQRAWDAMEEARNRSDTAYNRKYESTDEPVSYNIIDRILDAGSMPPQNIDPILLRQYGDFVTFDIFEQQDVTINEHLSADPDNIVIMYRRNAQEDFNAIVLTFTQLKSFLKNSSNIYYRCIPGQTNARYRLTPAEYVKIPTDTITIYASYPEMRQRCINGQRMIFLQYNHRIDTSISFNVSAGVAYTEDTGQFCPSVISANHCQLNSDIDIYNIIA